jgi:hypothetical protein
MFKEDKLLKGQDLDQSIFQIPELINISKKKKKARVSILGNDSFQEDPLCM